MCIKHDRQHIDLSLLGIPGSMTQEFFGSGDLKQKQTLQEKIRLATKTLLQIFFQVNM
jgi:hypothetical protein